MGQNPPSLLELERDPEFRRRFDEDPILRELEADAAHPELDALAAHLCLGGQVSLGALRLKAMTAGAWSALWRHGNAIVRGGKAGLADLDELLHAMSCPRSHLMGSRAQLDALAAGTAARSGLDGEALCDAVAEIVRTAFLALEQLPPPAEGPEGPPDFGAAWLARVCGTAAREANVTFDEAAWGMPLCLASHLFAERRLREDPEARRHVATPPETARAIMERERQLREEYIRELTDGRDTPEDNA